MPRPRLALVIVWLALAAGVSTRSQSATGIDVVIDEWTVPVGSRPHDPAVAPDGSIWYTGQTANTLGRLNPITASVTEYALPTPRSGPHGLVADAAGHIWYTGNTARLVGRLDPTTGVVLEFPMSDTRARDPHTPILDAAGTLWFTVQGGNVVGRLAPVTGETTVIASNTPNSLPYGIVIDSRGRPFFDLFGTNKVAMIDPETLEITEHALPAGARPRRIAVTRDDVIWYTDYARGFLGRLDPRTGNVTEFASPAGRTSRPYGMTSTSDGAIWYSESGVEPNTVVRFNPSDGSMQSWPIPSGGGIVRHMVTAPNDDVWLACSGVDRLARVRVVKPGTEAASTRRSVHP
ncbi:MAG: virginiamycin B lyase family protein [Vicinamibacterales bacterium]